MDWNYISKHLDGEIGKSCQTKWEVSNKGHTKLPVRFPRVRKLGLALSSLTEASETSEEDPRDLISFDGHNSDSLASNGIFRPYIHHRERAALAENDSLTSRRYLSAHAGSLRGSECGTEGIVTNSPFMSEASHADLEPLDVIREGRYVQKRSDVSHTHG